ncbi:hypothetical protein [Hyphomonas sp. BRH_c22]|uniref:hypothetical protein n=1 Tax=Hyphomonas sp. BRH_c22 TaxID=1629710 RepID=UPI0026176FBD|nr:hypothetical protein [Hyphomonas sp. BRH_c22]
MADLPERKQIQFCNLIRFGQLAEIQKVQPIVRLDHLIVMAKIAQIRQISYQGSPFKRILRISGFVLNKFCRTPKEAFIVRHPSPRFPT